MFPFFTAVYLWGGVVFLHIVKGGMSTDFLCVHLTSAEVEEVEPAAAADIS